MISKSLGLGLTLVAALLVTTCLHGQDKAQTRKQEYTFQFTLNSPSIHTIEVESNVDVDVSLKLIEDGKEKAGIRVDGPTLVMKQDPRTKELYAMTVYKVSGVRIPVSGRWTLSISPKDAEKPITSYKDSISEAVTR